VIFILNYVIHYIVITIYTTCDNKILMKMYATKSEISKILQANSEAKGLEINEDQIAFVLGNGKARYPTWKVRDVVEGLTDKLPGYANMVGLALGERLEFLKGYKPNVRDYHSERN
jgi:hypothetical protein